MVNAEFNWWLLIAGLVVGAGLTWLILADMRRSEDDVATSEFESEAAWIAGRLADAARPLSVDAIEAVLRAHREYLSLGAAELDEIEARLHPRPTDANEPPRSNRTPPS